MFVLSCDDAAECWHRRWHRNVISAIAECALIGAPAVPLIGVTSALGGDDAINSTFLVFKTGVSTTLLRRVRFPAASATASDLVLRASPPFAIPVSTGPPSPVVNALSTDALAASSPSRMSCGARRGA
jgi:hypothetical protein